MSAIQGRDYSVQVHAILEQDNIDDANLNQAISWALQGTLSMEVRDELVGYLMVMHASAGFRADYLGRGKQAGPQSTYYFLSAQSVGRVGEISQRVAEMLAAARPMDLYGNAETKVNRHCAIL